MASPFSIFRRNQKVMLAVLTLLAMFAFVFLDPLLQAFRGDVPDAVVVTTRRYGDLREQDIRNLIVQRQIVLNVLERVLVSGGFPPEFAAFQIQQFFGPPTEEAVVNAWLHAKRAESLGMVVDDNAVNEFLNSFLEQYTENRVQIADLREMLQRDDIPQRALFAALRNELLARQLRQSFQTSLWGIPPMQRWNYYQRLNRRATIELAPVAVVDFMDQVEDPGEDTLRAFFDEHKDRLWRPDSPEPAFREPKRIALQYFKAELDEFVDPKSVTEEEIARYYEENKDTEFLQPQAPPPREPDAPADAAPDAEPPAEPPVEQPAETPPSEEESMDDAQPPAEEGGLAEDAVEDTPGSEPAETPAEPDEPAPSDEATDPGEEPAETGETPAEPAEEPAQPAGEPAESEEPPLEPSEAAAPTPSDDARALPPREYGRPVMFTSLLAAEDESDAALGDEGEEAAEDQSETPVDEPPADEPPADEPPADEAPADEAPADEAPADEAPADEAPADEAPTPDGTEPGPAEDEPAAPEPSALDGPTPGERGYVPLAEVEDEIRTRLARRKAREQVEQLLRSLSARIRRYEDDRIRYEVQVETDPTAEPPEELDIGEIARENGLKAFETELISRWEAQTLDIGESLVEGSQPFVQYAFEEIPPYQPALSQAEDHYFLFWTTEQQEESVPDWDDANVRQRVLEAWKLVQARDLARDRAETLAERVRESGETLAEFFGDDSQQEVVQAGPFSWMTYGDVPPMLAREPPRISEVEGVDFTGHVFMRDVFSLDEGELGVTMNQPETFAYVVRMDSLVPPRTVLWEGFLVDDFGKYAAAGAPTFRQMQTAWQEQVEEAAGLEWKREPWRGRDQ